MTKGASDSKIIVRLDPPYLATVAIAVALLFIGNRVATQGLAILPGDSQEVVRARALEVTQRIQGAGAGDEALDPGSVLFSLQGESVVFDAEISRGPRRGEIVSATQSFRGFVQYANAEVAPGDSILLISFGDEWFFNGFYRAGRLLWLGAIFAFCVLLFGRKKGFNTLLSLSLTCAAVFAVFIPSILTGKNIYLMALLTCAYTTAATLLIVIGFNKKSLAALAGCMSGIAVAGLIALVMDRALFLTGVVDEHSRFLMNLPVDGSINLRAIVFAGIVIGAMGAIMDVAISVSSALWEIKESAVAVKPAALMRSGMAIGRDMFGTMANTLILAYIGTSLSVILILLVYTDSLASLMNMEMIVVEVLQALCGSFGILSAIPITSLFCSAIFSRPGGVQAGPAGWTNALDKGEP
ncbi:MAG: YibE/F family protein [Treponema sp.]|nr:YibE/F family protein [Treponema sp.]